MGVRCSMRSYTCIKCYFAVQMNNTLQWRWLTGLRYVAWLTSVGWMNIWNGCCRVGLWRAARTFACITACVLEFEVNAWKCVLNIGVRCSMRWYVISFLSSAILLSKWIIHYNGDDWRVCVTLLDCASLVECIYGTGVVVLAFDEQLVRLLVLLPVCLSLNCVLNIGVQCSMMSYVISFLSSAILLSK